MKIPTLPTLLLAASICTLQAQSKPNVIFVLVDDMGWGDLGVFYQNGRGASPKFVTPNLDTVAAEGMQLRRHYCPAPVCAPSRASLLLGVHQGHANVRDNSFDKELENNHTLGTVMKQAGYATGAIGKWGLQGSGLPAPGRPQLRGFDYFFGYLEHGDAHYHYPKETGANVYDGTTDVVANLDKCYSTDLIAARAKKWIVDQRTASPATPFFLYLAFTAPHARLDVPTQAYPAGKGVAAGVQWTGSPGAMINTATGTINSFIHPDYAAEATWPEYAKRYATMVRRIDDAVADLIQTLKDLSIDENTMIVFTSDNGPANEAGTGGSYTYNPTHFDSFGPMDGIKRDTWEGGMREPTLVRWPGHVTAGAISTAASQFHDWMPTLAEIAGLPAPARTDGVSLMPTLTGTGTQRESTIYVEYQYSGTTPSYIEFETTRRGSTRNQEQVIHLDGYKGIRYNIGSATDDFQIYNTLTDSKETTNLAGSSAYFTNLQQRMKDRVLQVRRPGGGVSRPYDSSNIPPATVTSTVAGLDYRAFEGTYPWVPDFTPLTAAANGSCSGIDLAVRTRNDQIGLLYTGYLNVPADGTYTIYLTTDSRAFLRLHDASIIDADFGYTGGVERSASVNLKAGKHPLRLGYVRGAGGTPSLSLQWSGPGISKQSIPAANLLRTSTEPVPPTANPDSATTTSGTSKTITVLSNDTAGSGPGPLAVTAVSTPTHGTAVISGGTQVIYTATAGYTGADSFTYTLSDGLGTATGSVAMTVVASIPPSANPDSATTAAGTSVSIPVLANDTDDGAPAPLSISAVTQPSGGSTAITGSNITYTPRSGFYGADSFTYTITDGADTNTATVSVTVQAPPGSTLWTTTFSGTEGTNRDITQANGAAAFTDTLSADDANLIFQDTSFTGTVFMHSGSMATGTYYSPRTNVDNPAAANPQNGGWWQSELRYSGGSQTVDLTEVNLSMVWSNSSGNFQTGDTSVRDITLSAEYSLNGGTSWLAIATAQTYNLTVNGVSSSVPQTRAFTFASPLTVDHATEDLSLRVKAENTNATVGAYVNIKSIAFVGFVVPPVNDYTTWAAGYSGANLTDPNADGDGDGLTNNEERLWGLDPTKGGSVSPFVNPLNATSGTFTYTRRNPALTQANYHYQWSDTLEAWNDFIPANETPGGTSPVESVTGTLPSPLLGSSKRFVRVLATED